MHSDGKRILIIQATGHWIPPNINCEFILQDMAKSQSVTGLIGHQWKSIGQQICWKNRIQWCSFWRKIIWTVIVPVDNRLMDAYWEQFDQPNWHGCHIIHSSCRTGMLAVLAQKDHCDSFFLFHPPNGKFDHHAPAPLCLSCESL